jgi:hypothetical protein
MSASGFTPIQLFRTSTASAIPSAGTLADGELAINLTDERLYFKNAAGVVKLLASNAGSEGTVTSVAASGGTTGLTFSGSPITTSGTLTLGGTLAVANGGTGVTSSTGSVSVVLSKSPTLETPILGAATATSIANGLGAVGTPSYTFVGDLNSGMWSPAVDTLAFSTNGAERMRVTSAGDVGIGTSAPAERLHVSGNLLVEGPSGTICDAIVDMADQRLVLGSYFEAGVGQHAFISSTNNAETGNSALLFRTGTTERMRIADTGNVGIGTVTPGARLDVNAGALGGTAGNTLDLSRFFGQTGGNQRALTTTLVRNSNGSDWTTTTMRLQAVVDATNSTYVDFSPNGTHDLAFGSLGSERMRITSAGNVGIGTTSPGAKLQINIQDGFRFDVEAGAASTMRFGSALTGESTGALAWVRSEGAMTFSSGATGSALTERMRIDASGNLGIGTASPAARLDLNGNTAQNIVAVAALDVDCTQGNFFTKTIAANSTFTFSNPPASRAYAFTLEIVHTSGTITWPTTVRWPGNTAPTLTTGRTHLITFVTDNGGTIWYGAPQTDYLV